MSRVSGFLFSGIPWFPEFFESPFRSALVDGCLVVGQFAATGEFAAMSEIFQEIGEVLDHRRFRGAGPNLESY